MERIRTGHLPGARVNAVAMGRQLWRLNGRTERPSHGSVMILQPCVRVELPVYAAEAVGRFDKSAGAVPTELEMRRSKGCPEQVARPA